MVRVMWPIFGRITLKRGMVRVMWPILNIWAPSDICRMAKARVVKFCTLVDYVVS